MIKIDLHNHTIASGHAVNTIDELCTQAKDRGIKYLGITDHGPSMEGAPQEGYFWLAKRIPKEINGIRVLFGVEANIVDMKGNVDISEQVLEYQDVVIAGLHAKTPYDKNVNNTCYNNTKSIISVIENRKCNILAHPIVEWYDVEIKEIAECSIANNVLLELNCQVFEKIDEYILEKYIEMIQIIKRMNAKLIIGSDTHYKTQLGDFQPVLRYKKILGLDDSLIINSCPDELKRYGVKI